MLISALMLFALLVIILLFSVLTSAPTSYSFALSSGFVGKVLKFDLQAILKSNHSLWKYIKTGIFAQAQNKDCFIKATCMRVALTG